MDNSNLLHKQIDSPVGPLTLIANDKALVAVHFGKNKKPEKSNSVIKEASKQLSEYFKGKRKEFDLPLEFAFGTPFQKSVWKCLLKVPYGKTQSYESQAIGIGKKKAVRAVSSAIGKNPLGIIVPCHRIIGKDKSLRGFAAGLKSKKFLLDHESVQ